MPTATIRAPKKSPLSQLNIKALKSFVCGAQLPLRIEHSCKQASELMLIDRPMQNMILQRSHLCTQVRGRFGRAERRKRSLAQVRAATSGARPNSIRCSISEGSTQSERVGVIVVVGRSLSCGSVRSKRNLKPKITLLRLFRSGKRCPIAPALS